MLNKCPLPSLEITLDRIFIDQSLGGFNLICLKEHQDAIGLTVCKFSTNQDLET